MNKLRVGDIIDGMRVSAIKSGKFTYSIGRGRKNWYHLDTIRYDKNNNKWEYVPQRPVRFEVQSVEYHPSLKKEVERVLHVEDIVLDMAPSGIRKAIVDRLASIMYDTILVHGDKIKYINTKLKVGELVIYVTSVDECVVKKVNINDTNFKEIFKNIIISLKI